MEEAGAERPLRVPVRLAGMLKSCQTKMSKPKKPGDLPQPWAILAIDDGENEIEALAFSKTFAKYKDWLPDEVERPVLVCGELSHRIGRESRVEEDEIQFVVREAYPLETGISVFSKAIVFPVHCGPDAPEYVKRIAKLAARFPGTLPARLEVAYPDGRIAELSLPGGVSPSSDFFSALTMEIKSAPYRLETSSVIFAEPPPDRQWGKRR